MRMKTIRLWIESQQLTRYKLLLTARGEADETASPDNSRAITESPQRRPGFQVNPPVHHNAAQQQTAPSRRVLNLAQTWEDDKHISWGHERKDMVDKIKKNDALPVNDDRVWRGLIPVPTTFLVTTPALVGEGENNVSIKNMFKSSLLTSTLLLVGSVFYIAPPPPKSFMKLVDDHGHVCRCWLVWFSENRAE